MKPIADKVFMLRPFTLDPMSDPVPADSLCTYRLHRRNTPQVCESAHRSGFTMIELLVVLTIIAILASLLLPSVLRAREKARQVHCANNLRQIGIASYSYSDEYGQYVMPGKFEDTENDKNYNHWINYMYAELLPDKDVFLCPSLGDDDHFNPSGGDNTIVQASYIRNIIEPGKWDGAAISTDPDKSWGWGTTTKPIRIQQVQNPADKVNIMDIAGGGMAATVSGIRRFDGTDHGPINDKPLSGFRRVGYHHRLGFNVLMGDGHIEHMVRSRPDQWVVVTQ